MPTSTKTKIKEELQASLFGSSFFAPKLNRSVEWFGGVNHENLLVVMDRIKTLMIEDAEEEVQLLVNSYGGATGIGMSFYDSIRSLLKPRLTTIGMGDVDSSGIIVFLSGEKRLLTRNTTLLFHLAGRNFGTEKRFSTLDLENLLKEDKVKDYQYACVVSDATSGRFSPKDILSLMKENTVLTPDEAVNMGLAHRVLG